jgi:signal transduction histidine kinase
MWEMLIRRSFVIRMALVLMVLVFSDVEASQETARKRVFVLHSYYQGYKWTDEENAGIESVLQPALGRNNLYVEYMDTKKIFGDLYSQRLYEVYKLKYRNFRFDTVIVTDNNAFDFIRKYRDELFPGTPVVFCGVNYFEEIQIRGQRLLTGINEENDFKACIEMILRLHPKTKEIVFINEWTSTGQNVHKAFLKTIPDFQGTVKFSLFEDVKIEEILHKLRTLPSDSVVLYSAFSRDKAGRIFDYDEIASLITNNCKVPVYTTNEFNLGLGVVGGLVVNGYDQGQAAARLALRILEGTNPEDLKVVMTSPKRLIFDYLQLNRFGIRGADLPDGNIVINLPETFYFKYKRWVQGAIVVFAALLLIISGLLINIRKRKATERELSVSREELRSLGWRLAETEEKERKAFSRELHDDIGQNLTILEVNLNLLKTIIPKASVELAHTRINDSLSVVKQMTDRVRSLMSSLRSPVLDDYGLVAAIDVYSRQCTARTGLNILVRAPETDPRLTPAIENTMFRIVQESLTNVVKHAQASQVIISVTLSGKTLKLTVEDDGVGYEKDQLPKSDGKRGWGFVTMSERALAVGGTCQVKSHLGMGTHVIVEVPL